MWDFSLGRVVFPLPLLSPPCEDLFLGCSLPAVLMDGNPSYEFDAVGGVWRLPLSLVVSIINMLIHSNIINRVNTSFSSLFSLLGKQQKQKGRSKKPGRVGGGCLQPPLGR